MPFLVAFCWTLQHDFIGKAEGNEILQEMIREAKEIQEMHSRILVNGDDSVSGQPPSVCQLSVAGCPDCRRLYVGCIDGAYGVCCTLQS